MVNESNQPPRNHSWFTFASGSETVAENAPSSHGFSGGPPPQRINPPAMGRTACGLCPTVMKFLAWNENTASSGALPELVNRYSTAATGRLELSGSPGSKGLQPVISTCSESWGSESVTTPKGN